VYQKRATAVCQWGDPAALEDRFYGGNFYHPEEPFNVALVTSRDRLSRLIEETGIETVSALQAQPWYQYSWSTNCRNCLRPTSFAWPANYQLRGGRVRRVATSP